MWEEVLLFLVPFRSQIFDAFFDVFLDLVILPYFDAISMDFLCRKVFNLHFFCVISMFVSGKMLIKRFKCLKNLNEFFMYLLR